MTHDKLFEIFEQRLYSTDRIDESHEEFIFAVIEDYVTTLIEAAHIPINFLASLQEDLEEEVGEMLQIKIYGHYSLKAFRKSLGQDSQV